MINRYKITIYLIFSLFFSFLSFAQKSTPFQLPDSLKNVTYKELESNYYSSNLNKEQKEIYANTYLAKAKKEKSRENIVHGYWLIGENNRFTDLESNCIDSIIVLTQNNNTKKFPAAAYLSKALNFYEKGDLRNASDNYLIAAQYAKKNENNDQLYFIRFSISKLKNQLGEEEEALSYFKEFYNYTVTLENSNRFRRPRLEALFALSDSYNKLRKLDSARIYLQKGITLSLQAKDSILYPNLLLVAGINQYHERNYRITLDNLQKAKRLLSNKKHEKCNYLVCLLYLGKTYYNLENKEKAMYYFSAIDSVFKETKIAFPQIREAYELLIDNYKKKKDKETQLYYMNQLIHVDSILRANYEYLFKDISKKYEVPQLLEDKENLINSLNKKEKYSFLKITILSVSIFLLLSLLLFYYRKHKQDRVNFEKLLQEQEKPEIKETKVVSNIELPQTVISELLLKLQQFEKDFGFLSNDCTIGLIAKKLETNSNYLSKVINSQKGCNFSTYINELRVDYAIDKLKKDHQFRLFTINAIATEVGFNNSESFSKAFYKKTGIYPSYFINELKKI